MRKPGWAMATVLALLLSAAPAASAQAGSVHTDSMQSPWQSIGPFGGNARALAYNPTYPDHILLGSGGGALFESLDDGLHWRPLAQLGADHDLMVQSVLFDPARSRSIYAAGWNLSGLGGGFFLSRDGGRSWSESSALRGKSIQALAIAASAPQILIAGALDGLYRSLDSGESWSRITPEGDPDLKNFESVAIDPHDPQTIYAGTWHLPWKTVDGGLHWSSIKQGVIDDSDVFSIILDREHPETVFASACSGIYRSDDAGGLFRKVQGIPGSASRTRVLRQDPSDAATVYAGTTQGLWKTIDGGREFKRITPPDFILNGVLVDPRNRRRLLIATDRGGVFASDDAGESFYPSNEGFSQRQITTMIADPVEPFDLYAGTVNDKEFGGVFRRHNGRWTQLNDGLSAGIAELGAGSGEADIFDLLRSPGGRMVAATNRGIFHLEAGARHWEPSQILMESRVTAPQRGKQKTSLRPGDTAIRRPTVSRATALAAGDGRWYAASTGGVLVSSDEGSSWRPTAMRGDFLSVSARERAVAAAGVREVWYSDDLGEHWSRQPLPAWVTRIYAVTVASPDELWVATREGVLRWQRNAAGSGEWEHVLNGLPAREVIWLRLEGGWLLAAAAASNAVFVSRDQGQSWQPEPAADFEVSGAVLQAGKLYAITRQHGVLERRRPAASEGGSTPAGE